MSLVPGLISGSDFVRVNVSNSKNDGVALDVKFLKSLTVAELKSKLEVITGGNAGTMRLELYSSGNKLLSELTDNAALLGSLPIDEGARIHVIDNFLWIADDNVEKFDLTEDQYEKKDDTLRSFLKRNRLGKYNEEEMKEKEENRRQQELLEKERANQCTVGARCQVRTANNPTRRGTIRYTGELEGKKGIFIGIEYDEPLGKNNGSVGGKAYFKCAPNYGGFVPPMSVEVGDFPPDMDEMDEI